MARKSQQAGTLQWHNDQWTLLYRVKNHSTGRFSQKRECAAFAQFRDRNDKKAAREFANEFLKPVNRLNSNPHAARQVNPQPEATFEWFIKTRWASYVQKRKIGVSTLVTYNCFINKYLLPAFGNCALVEITTGRLTDFFDSLYDKLKESSIGNIYRLLSLMFDICLEYDLIESKPLRKKLHKPEFEREEKPTLSVEDARKILKALSYAHRLFITVLGVFTIRVNEAAALRWMNLDFESGVLSLTHGVYKRRLKSKLKTRASRRKFEVPKPLLDALKHWRSQSPFNSVPADGRAKDKAWERDSRISHIPAHVGNHVARDDGRHRDGAKSPRARAPINHGNLLRSFRRGSRRGDYKLTARLAHGLRLWAFRAYRYGPLKLLLPGSCYLEGKRRAR